MIKYQNKLVAFIDVLGFKHLIDSKNLDILENYFDYISKELDKYFNGKKRSFILISDAIVIYDDFSIENLTSLIHTIGMIQAKLLSRKILLRGAISFGKLFVDEEKNIIVGPGLVNAYQLESIAENPQIILDRRLLAINDVLIQLRRKRNSKWLNFENFDADTSGFIYINYFKFITDFTFFQRHDRIYIIVDFIIDNLFNNKTFKKYQWVKFRLENELKTNMEYLSNRLETVKNKTSARKIIKFNSIALERLIKVTASNKRS